MLFVYQGHYKSRTINMHDYQYAWLLEPMHIVQDFKKKLELK